MQTIYLEVTRLQVFTLESPYVKRKGVQLTQTTTSKLCRLNTSLLRFYQVFSFDLFGEYKCRVKIIAQSRLQESPNTFYQDLISCRMRIWPPHYFVEFYVNCSATCGLLDIIVECNVK